MLGTIVNTVTIIVCSMLGLFIKGAHKYETQMKNALGLAVLFLGVSGGVSGLMDPDSDAVLFICSLVFGALIGEFLHIDIKFQRFGEFLGNRFGNSGTFAKGFVTASLIYCVGAMAIVGAFESGLSGNHTILFAKSTLDGVMSIVLASTLGIGVAFSAIPVFLYQGTLTALADFLSPLITPDSIRELSAVGNVLIAAIGLEMLGIAKINYANMLPAVFIPLIVYTPAIQSIIEIILSVF